MSGHHFHVHGPHDHAVEHAGHGGHGHGDDDSFGSRIAVLTAVLSTIGALCSYEGGATQNDAMLHKNDAAIKKTEASNRWNYYQAKSNKQNLAELAVALNAGRPEEEKYRQEVERYKTEKVDIKKEAEALEAESKHSDELSDHSMHTHHRWAQGMTAIQVAISLAAMTLLTKRRWLLLASYGTAGLGVLLSLLALAHI